MLPGSVSRPRRLKVDPPCIIVDVETERVKSIVLWYWFAPGHPFFLELDEPLGLPIRQARPEGGKGELERTGRHPPEVLVMAHRREPERATRA